VIMAIRDELLDELLKGYKGPEDLLGEGGILQELTKRLLERALEGEMTEHLGYTKHAAEGKGTGNSRNGHGEKTVTGKGGEMKLRVPRDRKSEFEPQIVGKRQKRFDGFDDRIISLYARGMTTREIQEHLHEMYKVEVSPALISTVTDAVLDDVKAWQSRPLDPVYPIVFLDAIMVKSRQDGQVCNRAVYMALGVNMEGQKELLGLWIAGTEGAKFWMGILNELKNRGVRDMLICCVDGLTGFPDAIEAVYPQTQVQLCIVHMVRHSLKYVSWKERKTVARDLKAIYSAATVEEAELALDEFAARWDGRYPTISVSWRRHWAEIIPFFAFPGDIRRAIYTTNAIESLNRTLRKVIKNRQAFPTDEAILKILYLALNNASKKWTMPIYNWKAALNQFAIAFEGRLA
jgi:putative transposase